MPGSLLPKSRSTRNETSHAAPDPRAFHAATPTRGTTSDGKRRTLSRPQAPRLQGAPFARRQRRRSNLQTAGCSTPRGHAPEFRALHYSKVIRVNDRPPEVITRPTPMATGLQGPKGWPTRFPPLGHPNTSTAATDAHSGQRPPRRPCEPFQCPRGDALQVKTLSLGGSGGIFVLTMVLRDAPTQAVSSALVWSVQLMSPSR